MSSAKKRVSSKKEDSEDGKPLWKEILEVLGSLVVILIVLRLLLGANMPVPLVAVVSCSMLHGDDVIGSISYGFADVVGPLLLDGVCRYDASGSWQEWIKERVPDAQPTKYPLSSGFSVGDMILVMTPDGKGTLLPFFPETKIGDVVIYKRDRRSTGNEPIIHRVVGIVKVNDGGIERVEGTLDCFTRKDFEEKFIPYVLSCQSGNPNCLYKEYPRGGSFRFYMTKGDNNKGTDQCSGILPVTDSQVLARGWIRIPYLGWLKMVLNRILGVLFGVSFMFVG
jgi:signal peptidase I